MRRPRCCLALRRRWKGHEDRGVVPMSTILVVDDEYLIVDIIGYALEDEGYRVERAGNGVKALEVLEGLAREQGRVDLIITDYMMPLMNGEELARAVRTQLTLSSVPIILISGAQASIGRDNPELFAAVLDKPFEFDALIATVKKLIGPAETS